MKILVIHATAGAGHKKAAEAIYNGLQSQGGHDVRLVDALDYTNPFFKWSYPQTYTFLVTKISFLWGFFFAVLDIPFVQPMVRLIRRIYNGANAAALQKFLKEEQFDVILTTQFLSAEVSSHLRKTGQIKSKVICVVTDFDVHRIWINQGTDLYSCACDYTCNKLISLGIHPERVYVTGIPTDAKFSKSVEVGQLKEQLNLKSGVFTVLIATGSFGMGPIKELILALKGYQLLVVCGHNKTLYQTLGPLNKNLVHVYGLVNNMDELMSVADVMVTKPGGLSIAEALVKRLPTIFFSAIPGQETNNIKVLNTYDDHYRNYENIEDIVRRIDDLSDNLEVNVRTRQSMMSLSKPNAVKDIIQLL